jgi:hypothetical protein
MSVFPDTFLEALLDEGSDAPAMRALRETPSESVLVEHEPSPRAMPYFCKGEWDSFMMLVLLTIVKRWMLASGLCRPLSLLQGTYPKRNSMAGSSAIV